MMEIRERLAGVRHQIALLRAQEDMLLDILGERTPAVTDTPARTPRANVKQTVLDLLQRVKGNGLNATIAVDMAKNELGVIIERGTVSSLLSRMKSDKVVSHVGGLYRLAEYTAQPVTPPIPPKPPAQFSAPPSPPGLSGVLLHKSFG